MTSENREKIQYKINLTPYMLELNNFVLKRKGESDLLSIEKTRMNIEKSKNLDRMVLLKKTIPFAEKSSEKFKKYISLLQKANPAGVYIWLERTSICGTTIISSLKDINWGFDFNCSKNGVVEFVSTDLQDKILFDFFEEDGEQLLEIEVQGTNWPKINWEEIF